MNKVLMIGYVTEISKLKSGPNVDYFLKGSVHVSNNKIKRRKFSDELTWDFVVWGETARRFANEIVIGDFIELVGDLRRSYDESARTTKEGVEISIHSFDKVVEKETLEALKKENEALKNSIDYIQKQIISIMGIQGGKE